MLHPLDCCFKQLKRLSLAFPSQKELALAIFGEERASATIAKYLNKVLGPHTPKKFWPKYVQTDNMNMDLQFQILFLTQEVSASSKCRFRFHLHFTYSQMPFWLQFFLMVMTGHSNQAGHNFSRKPFIILSY